MNDLPRAVHLLNAAPITATAYRLGRILMDLTRPCELLELPCADLCKLARVKTWASVRKLLRELRSVGLFNWSKRGAAVRIMHAVYVPRHRSQESTTP